MLPSLAASFTAGLALGSYIPYLPLSITVLLLCSAIGLTFFESRLGFDPRKSTAIFCSLLAGIVYWSILVEGNVKPAFQEEGAILHSLTGRVVVPVRQGPDRLIAIVQLDQVPTLPRRPQVIRLTWRNPERLIFQGDRIGVVAKLRPPSGPLNPGRLDYAAYLDRQGIDALATVHGAGAVVLLESGRNNVKWALWNQFDRWRGGVRLAAIQSLSQPALGLFMGIIVGERGFLDQAVRDRFMVTGTVHLLSISGSHIGLVAIVVFVAVRRFVLLLPPAWLLSISRKLTATRLATWLTVFPVTAYTLLAGAEVATVRSLAMVIVALAARWGGHKQSIFHALSVAAVGILLHDPQAIYDISFQLSFVSVGAIGWWVCRSNEADEKDESTARPWSGRVLQWGKDTLTVSTAVTVATTPLIAAYFNQVPWLGLFANIVAIPLMGAGLVPIGLAAAVWQIVTESEILPLAGTIQWLVGCFTKGLDVAASIPFGDWHVAAPSVSAMVIFYTCMALLLAGGLKKHLVWLPSAVVVASLSWWIWSPRSHGGGEQFRVTFLDVEQGDSAVIELPDGQVVLIDGGTAFDRYDMGRTVVAPFLWNRGIRTIDHVIATHPQLDHVGGLTWILEHFHVRHFWGNGDQRTEAFYEKLKDALARRRLQEEIVREGQNLLSSNGCRLQVLNPHHDAKIAQSSLLSRRDGRTLNNRSVVTELWCGAHRILFTSDIEQEALWRLKENKLNPEAEVVKVPHHGAGGSLQIDWLKRVKPRFAVISVGRYNPYGHPDQAVLQAYAGQGVTVYRTDEDGAVWMIGRIADPSLEVHSMKDALMMPIDWVSCGWNCERENLAKLIAIG